MKPIKTSMKMNITLEIEVEVFGEYTKEIPETRYRSNGDPGDPAEPEQFEVHSVLWQEIDITTALDESGFDFNSLEEDCINKFKD